MALGLFVHHFAIWQRHTSGGGWEAHPVHLLNNLGQSAVFLFFMVTGALFYERIIASERAPHWISIYISRAFRLTPLYWVAVLIVICIVLSYRFVEAPGIAAGKLLSGKLLFRSTVTKS